MVRAKIIKYQVIICLYIFQSNVRTMFRQNSRRVIISPVVRLMLLLPDSNSCRMALHAKSRGIDVKSDTTSNETMTSLSAIVRSCIRRRMSVVALTVVGEVSVNGIRAFDIHLARSYVVCC